MSTQYPHLRRGIVCAFLGGVCWGFSANCAEVLMGDYGVPVGWLTSMRLLFSALFFLGLIGFTARDKVVAALKDASMLARIAAYALFGVFFIQVSYMEAIARAGAGPALLLQQLGLVIVMLYLCVRQRRAPYAREMLGLVFALAGVAFIATQGNGASLAIPVDGLAWGLVTAVALALYNLLPVKPLAKYGSILVTGVALLMGCVVSCAVFQPWSVDVQLPLRGWLVLAAVVAVGTIAAYVLYMQGVKEAGPMRAGLIGCVEPLSAMVISAVWLGTPISLFDVLGAACIVAMIALVTEREKKPDTL